MCRPYDVPCNIQPKHGISKAGYIPHKKAVYTTSDQWFYKMATTSCDNSLSVKELGINLQFYLFLINSSLMSYRSYCRLLIKNYYFGEIYVKLLICFSFYKLTVSHAMQCNNEHDASFLLFLYFDILTCNSVHVWMHCKQNRCEHGSTRPSFSIRL